MNKKQYISKKIKDYYKNRYKNNIVYKNITAKNIANRRKGGIYKIYDNLKNRIYKTVKNNNLKFNLHHLW